VPSAQAAGARSETWGEESPMPVSSQQSFQPLPFVDRRPRALFVDRWGTLLAPAASGACKAPAELRFVPGALEALARASQAGWHIYLVGNEDAVARGELSADAWNDLCAAIEAAARAAGAEIKRSYACLDTPRTGVGEHKQESAFLFPNTGVFHHAGHEDDAALEHSWTIGDSTLELTAAWRAGVHTCGVRTGLALGDKTFAIEPEVVVKDLRQAVAEILAATSALRW
jgi:D-glycero-D-manno-heptose 1,7-bisphosphate phosphatase